jgi:hypothetical protein
MKWNVLTTVLGKSPDQNYIGFQRKDIVWRIKGHVSILGKGLETSTYRYFDILVQP